MIPVRGAVVSWLSGGGEKSLSACTLSSRFNFSISRGSWTSSVTWNQ